MNWYIGQEIVCIRTHSQGVVKRGQTFVISGVRSSTCKCSELEIDIGVISPHGYRICCCEECGYEFYEPPRSAWWLHESLFAPLEYNQEASDELLAVEEPVGK